MKKKADGRTKEEREKKAEQITLETERIRLVEALGHEPSPAEEILINRILQKNLRCGRHEEQIRNGDHTSESFYISLCNSLRRDLSTLGIRGVTKEPVKEGLDLSKLSLDELLALRKIVLKANGQSVEEEKQVPLLEYCPEVEIMEQKEEAKSDETEIVETINMNPLPTTSQETEEEREERIQYHHWLKMRKGLQKDPEPWDL